MGVTPHQPLRRQLSRGGRLSLRCQKAPSRGSWLRNVFEQKVGENYSKGVVEKNKNV